MKTEFVASKNLVDDKGSVLVEAGKVAVAIDSPLTTGAIVAGLTNGSLITKEDFERKSKAKAAPAKAATGGKNDAAEGK